MYDMARLVVIDTHIAVEAEHFHGSYWGRCFKEHDAADDDEVRRSRRWASADNETSFWFTRPSLINILTEAGFSSVYECFSPTHMNFGRPGIESPDRCTFVAVKAAKVDLITSPAANGLTEKWPEGSLSYAKKSPVFRWIKARILGP